MKSMLCLILLLLILGGAMWFYSKYFGMVLGRTSTAVTVARAPDEQEAEAETSDTAAPEPEPGSRRTGDAIRKTEIGRQIQQIQAQHNRSIEDAAR